MRIIIDTSAPLSRTEARLLELLLSEHAGLTDEPTPAKKAPAKKAPAKKAPAKKTPEPQEAEEDITEAEGDTMEPQEDTTEELETVASLLQRATDEATEYLNQGKHQQLKDALASVGVGRVRDLKTADQIQEFLGLLA